MSPNRADRLVFVLICVGSAAYMLALAGALAGLAVGLVAGWPGLMLAAGAALLALAALWLLAAGALLRQSRRLWP